MSETIKSRVPLVQLLSTNGDGTGTVDMAANLSDTDFYIAGDQGSPIIVHRLLVHLEDTGSIDASGFGNGSALTNGLRIDLESHDGTVLAPLTPETIKTNGEWGKYCYDVNVLTWGTGPEILLARWTLSKFTPGGVVLDNGARLVVNVNDNLSALNTMHVTAEGHTTEALSAWVG